MGYFIEAAADIITREGVPGVTIRKVAARAGYSSASLYKYFDSIDQLVAFAAIRSLKGLMEDLAAIARQTDHPMEKYVLAIFACSCHTFRNPKMFWAILVDRMIEPGQAFEQYYSAFPEERLEIPQDLYETFFASDGRVRTHLLMERCAAAGLIRREDLDEISVFANIIFEGIVARQTENPQLYDEYYHLRMIKQVLTMYNPELQPLLERIPLDIFSREKSAAGG